MKVFLTGSTGFIGQKLTQTLIQRGWEVITLVRNPESIEALAVQTMEGELVQGDITERESVRKAMMKADVLIHNAGWYKFGIPKAAQDRMRMINVQGTKNTLGLAAELGISKIIYVSTILVFGDTGGVVTGETFQRFSA